MGKPLRSPPFCCRRVRLAMYVRAADLLAAVAFALAACIAATTAAASAPEKDQRYPRHSQA